jgi:small neutral amino acid transporter SnatA (MarC family)
MGWHQFVGTTLLLYGLINPVGVVPIYSRLVRKSSADRTHRILLVASLAVGCLLIVAALWGEPILACGRRQMLTCTRSQSHRSPFHCLWDRRVLGTTGINVVTRIMALIVASFAIDFILSGLKNQFPGLK